LFRVLFDEDTQNPMFAAAQVLEIHYFQPVGCGHTIRGLADLHYIQCHTYRFFCRKRKVGFRPLISPWLSCEAFHSESQEQIRLQF
jgi:hypothetical protein